MAFGERIMVHVRNAQHQAQLGANIFVLRAESAAVLQALGVPRAYHLSLHEQDILTDAFAANIARAKQGGWFAIDTEMAGLRGNIDEARDRYRKMGQLEKAGKIFNRKYEKGRTVLDYQSRNALDAALDTAEYSYNVTLRGETSRLVSVDRLRACRRVVRGKARQMLLSQAA